MSSYDDAISLGWVRRPANDLWCSDRWDDPTDEWEEEDDV